MASFVVLTPRDGVEKDDETVLIRDGFAWLALVFPLIWLLWNRLWFATLMLLLLSVAIAAAIAVFPDQSLIFTAASLVVSVFVALEGNGWRIGKKERLGWTFRTVVEAPDRATAEEIWFSQAAAAPGAEKRCKASPHLQNRRRCIRRTRRLRPGPWPA